MKSTLFIKLIANFEALLFIIIIASMFQSCADKKRNPHDNIDSFVKEELLSKGKMAYNIPDTMDVGTQAKAIVSITKALDNNILFYGLDYIPLSTEEYDTTQIIVSSKVKVSLIDPSNDNNFIIHPLNTEEQFVSAKSNTVWAWNITPLRSGENNLLLRVTVSVLSDLGQTQRDIPVFDKLITVKASPLHNIGQFIGDNWQWLLGTIIFPLLVWKYNQRKKVVKKQK
jgi:hypothetical protein